VTRRSSTPASSVRRLLGALALSCVLASCTSVRNDLGTSDSNCYVALPAATNAVHSVGHLVGVHLVPLSTIRRQLHHLYADLPSADRKIQRVCLVAFAGSFRANRVSSPRGHPSGHLAVVVLSYPDNQVLVTILFRRLPLHFGHSHFGA
jgi:hypothetical protein